MLSKERDALLIGSRAKKGALEYYAKTSQYEYVRVIVLLSD